jgi:hypothetical protein
MVVGEIGGRFRLGPGVLAAALRVSYERYSFVDRVFVPCDGTPPSMSCIASSTGGAAYLLDLEAVAVALPVTWRFGPHDAAWRRTSARRRWCCSKEVRVTPSDW